MWYNLQWTQSVNGLPVWVQFSGEGPHQRFRAVYLRDTKLTTLSFWSPENGQWQSETCDLAHLLRAVHTSNIYKNRKGA